MKLIKIAAIALCFTGCATYHTDLMTNDQLIQASCQDLALEETKVAENAEHTKQAATGGTFGAAFLAGLEAFAATPEGGSQNVGNSGSTAQADLAEQHRQQAEDLKQRADLIAKLRSRKGC
jgi:hypothetical protein